MTLILKNKFLLLIETPQDKNHPAEFPYLNPGERKMDVVILISRYILQ